MAEWTIYGKNGVAKATVKELELHDEWMAECFLTVTVRSHEPVYFAVGDYIDYRNERYTINYDPSVVKKARRDTYGDGFVYDNIKFVGVQNELVLCDFNDIVLSDNKVHYTSLATFPFYCETADDLLDRIQANLEELYPGEWIVISPMLDRDRQRGFCVGREQAFVNAYNRYIGGGSFSYEKTGVAITVDNITCWEALSKVHSDFSLDFIIRGRVVIVGTAGVFTGSQFRYGKGNGLYEIELVGDSEQRIVTRLRAYGAETNLPLNYYAHKHDKMFLTGTKDIIEGEYAGGYNTYVIRTRITYSSIKSSIRREDTKCLLSHGNKKCYALFDSSVDDDGGVSYLVARLEDDGLGTNLEFYNSISDGDRVYIEEGINIAMWPDDYIETGGDYPALLTINRLMLPGFPDRSLLDWVQENRPELIEEGFDFSDDVNRPYIDSPNVSVYGIRPYSIYFDGSNETEDIHPTIEGMTWGDRASDEVDHADQIEDNGVLPDDADVDDKRFDIYIPYAGFDMQSLYQDGAAIEMKDGMCGARAMKIVKVNNLDMDNNWQCTCERAYDETLHIYFPYNDFQIRNGDHFVLTGIDLPDSYIEAASIRLFDAAVEALRKNHAPRVTFQPRIDEIWMQRQHDIAVASQGVIESLHDTLKAGDYFAFADDDLGIDAQIIIDVLTIKENGNNGIPTYEVTLREEKVVSTLEKTIQKITSGVNGGAGGSGGYNSRQVGSLIELEGSRLFLSKIKDDEAKGVIGFLKGAWFGTKQWMIDALGNATLNNVTVSGILRALNSYINKVRSTNYTGDGMLDTGWQIINDYEGSNSKAVFDYLYVRKKAIFEELEIRKLSHIGGNFCLSPASGRVWRVELYDSEVGGNLLGYSEVTVPYTLGGQMLSLFKKLYGRLVGQEQGRYLFGRQKLVARKLTPQEIAACKRIRVYMFTDDGTTKTMQNWTVGAQARCQTFNIEEQMDHISGGSTDNPDVEFWTGQKVQNHYWWRLVTAMGEDYCNDGKKHAYIEFLENQVNQRTHSDAGSDIPEVGDEFGQFGHRTRSDQSNVIMIETANDDSPAMKFYHGINSWNLNGKRPIILSPTLVEMQASTFRWITSYGDDTGQVTKRGLWINIQVDSQNHRRCYPNDVVSHTGTMWRCIVASGSHKEDANGNWLTQAQVDAMTLEQQMALLEVENYTIQEPSASATDWVEYTDEAIAPYIKFSEALIAVPCEKDRKASETVNKTITVKLMVTNLEATITSVTIEGADSYVYRSGNNIVVNVPKNTVVTNKDYIVTVEGNCLNNHFIASDKVSVFAAVRGNDAYEVHATPSQWIWNQEGADMSREEIIRAIEEGTELTFHIMIDKVELLPDGVTMGNSCAQIKVTNDGVDMPFTINSVSTSEAHVGTSYNNRTGRVWVTSIPDTLESGFVDVNITYGDNANLTVRIPFYCNLLGTWREQIIGDTRVAIANRTKYLDDEYTAFHAEYVQSSSENSAHFQRIDTSITNLQNADNTISQNLEQAKTDLNNSISTAQTTLQGEINATNTALNTAKTDLAGDINTVSVNLATYEQTANGQIAAITERVGNSETAIVNTNTRIDTAEGSIQTLQTDVSTVDGRVTATNTRVSTAETNISSIQSVVYDDQGNANVIKRSEFTQNASGYSLMNYQIPNETYVNNSSSAAAENAEDDIIERLDETGIDIDGDNRTITLYGNKVTFVTSSGSPANISFDTSHGVYTIGGFYINNNTIYSDYDGGNIRIYRSGGINITGTMSSGGANVTGNFTAAGGDSNYANINYSGGVNINNGEAGGNTNIGKSDKNVNINGSVYAGSFIETTGDVRIKYELKIYKRNSYGVIGTDTDGFRIYYNAEKLNIKAASKNHWKTWDDRNTYGIEDGEIYVSDGGVLKVRGLD